MRDIASSVPSFLGASAALIRVVKFEGFGGRREGEAALVGSDGQRAGSVLSGAADVEISRLDFARGSVTVVPVGDSDAVRSGLACGGTAHLLLQPLSTVPTEAWERIATRDPFVLVSRVDGERVGESYVVGFGESPAHEAHLDPDVSAAAKTHLSMGKAPTNFFDSAAGAFYFETVSPPPHAAVIGTAELGKAIERQGALLGWSCEIVDERVDGGVELSAKTASGLGPVDALIVLSHDLPASCAALATALRGRCGYVGALGSRHTQAARRERLITVEQISPDTAERVHGPIGLDLGSRTPEETALAIFAEILAVRRGRAASSLSSTTAPIH